MKISIKSFFNSHKGFFLKTIFVCICLLVTYVVAVFAIKNYEEKRLMNYPFEVMKHEAELSYNEYKSELVKVVKNYIDDTTNLDAEGLLNDKEAKDFTKDDYTNFNSNINKNNKTSTFFKESTIPYKRIL